MKTIALILFTALSIPSSGKEIIIAVNGKSDVEKLSIKDIKSIFTGEKASWDDGKGIIVVDYKRDNKLKEVFCKKVLKISQVQLYKKWIRASLLGKANEILLVDNQEEMLKYLKRDQKSIGYLENTSLNEQAIRKIKVTK